LIEVMTTARRAEALIGLLLDDFRIEQQVDLALEPRSLGIGPEGGSGGLGRDTDQHGRSPR
jgi:hypothetical protein